MKEQIILLKAWIDSMPASALDHQVQHSRLDVIEKKHNDLIDQYRQELSSLKKEVEELKTKNQRDPVK